MNAILKLCILYYVCVLVVSPCIAAQLDIEYLEKIAEAQSGNFTVSYSYVYGVSVCTHVTVYSLIWSLHLSCEYFMHICTYISTYVCVYVLLLLVILLQHVCTL